MTVRTSCRLAIGLGIASLLALVLAGMALVDISHGEADPSLEWTVLRVALAVILTFDVFGLITLVRVNLRLTPEARALRTRP